MCVSSSPSQWPLLWFRLSFLCILFQTHMANFCLREPCKVQIWCHSPAEFLNGASETPQGQIWFALPFFLCFAFIYRLHFPCPHPLYTHTHTLPSSAKEVLLLCSSHPRAFVHIAFSASFPNYLANPDTLFKFSLKHYNLLSWSGLPCWEFWPSWYWCPHCILL